MKLKYCLIDRWWRIFLKNFFSPWAIEKFQFLSLETFNNMPYPFDCTFHLPLCITNANCKHIYITRIGEIPEFIDQCDLECTEITSVKNTLNKRHVFAECYHLNAWNGVTILRCPQQGLWLCLYVPNHILTFKFKCWHNCTHYLRLSLHWVEIFNCICMNRMTLMFSNLQVWTISFDGNLHYCRRLFISRRNKQSEEKS